MNSELIDQEPNIIDNLSNPHWWMQKCTEDLYVLCRNVLQTIEDPTPGFKDLYEPTHRRMCQFLEDYAQPGQYVLILFPRHWIKSYIITCGWALQRLMKNSITGNRDTFLFSHAVETNAVKLKSRIKENLRYNDFLRGMLAATNAEVAKQLIDPENTAELWTKEEDRVWGNLLTVGAVEKTLESQHFSIHIGDDLVVRENSKTPQQIEKVKDWWKLARSLLSPNGIEILIGTRWGFDDLYGYLIEEFLQPKRGYNLKAPIIELHKGNFHLLQADCWEDQENEKGSTFPVMFPEKKLKQLRKELKDEFNYQYRNDPIVKGQHKFRKEYFGYYTLSDIPRVVNTVMLLDVTDKTQIKSDYTGMVIADIGVDKKIYIRKGERKKITDAKLIDWVIEEACKWQPSTIGIESMKYATLVELLELLIPKKFEMGEILKEHREYVKTLPFIIYECKHRGRPKQIRIENMAGFVEKHDVLFPRDGAEHLIEELIRLGSSIKDDTADAFGYLQDVLVYPKRNDPPKTYLVPEELRKTAEQREREEWESIKESLESSNRDIFDEPTDLY